MTTILHGDCVEVMRCMEECSVDAVVCDPPYGLEFMGREWDKLWATRDKSEDLSGKSSSPFLAARVDKYLAGKQAEEWHLAWTTEAFRVLKPGGHLLAFGGTRTYHRLTCAIEDAGFEIRDSIMHVGVEYHGSPFWAMGSGFPKGRRFYELEIIPEVERQLREQGVEDEIEWR